jgi:hypothetical protein
MWVRWRSFLRVTPGTQGIFQPVPGIIGARQTNAQAARLIGEDARDNAVLA